MKASTEIINVPKPVVGPLSDPMSDVQGKMIDGFQLIIRYGLPIVVIVFNNNGVYRGDAVNKYSSDPAPTVFTKGSRYDKLIEAFGGTGYHVEDSASLTKALQQALEARTPALINCVIDSAVGTEGGHISSLN